MPTPPPTPREILKAPLPIVRIDAGPPLCPPPTISMALDTLPSFVNLHCRALIQRLEIGDYVVDIAWLT